MALLNRQARVEKQMNRALMPILLTYGSAEVRAQVVVQSIQISRDLSHAKVFVKARQAALSSSLLAALNAEKSLYKKALAKAISLKKMPDLKFYLDELAQAEHRAAQAMDSVRRDEDASKR